MVETVRTLKIYDLDGKPFDRVEKGARGRAMNAAFKMPWETKVDILFEDGRMFMIPKRWLKKVKSASR